MKKRNRNEGASATTRAQENGVCVPCLPPVPLALFLCRRTAPQQHHGADGENPRLSGHTPQAGTSANTTEH
jgi:hypothetical protein